jgi:hypothetical protein
LVKKDLGSRKCYHKRVPKAASGHMNRFWKAAQTVFFRKPDDVATSGFRKPFHDCKSGLKKNSRLKKLSERSNYKNKF